MALITAIRYHNDATIRANLIAQKNHVGDRLELIETNYLPNMQIKNLGGQTRTWGYLGLCAEWNTFMRTRTARAITDTFNHIDTYLQTLEEGFATQADRNIANSAPDNEDGRFIAKIDALRTEWTNNRPVWNNPF
ncbi:hypothetical protein DM02DRAFT_635445 [Periconia macrospinosa]|uniref:Uncharacterized protein n=1 Tax=Periconia macrospinosa TaxID=97972 RepID=A0A2V1D2T7_9PLEO|nr:hypothetical protein DM02DRAFT_635445 [Periconia macrospinosa]